MKTYNVIVTERAPIMRGLRFHCKISEVTASKTKVGKFAEAEADTYEAAIKEAVRRIGPLGSLNLSVNLEVDYFTVKSKKALRQKRKKSGKG